MTAFWNFLCDLTPADWVLLFVAWVLVSFCLGTFTGMGIRLADRRDERSRVRVYEPTWDETWADAWPAADSDEDEVDLRFRQILAAEGLS